MNKYICHIHKKYEQFKNTLSLCSDILSRSAEREWIVFEELNISIPCYLCDENLNDFFDNYMIDNEIKEMSIQLRNLFMNLQDGEQWNIKSIWYSIDLQIIIELSNEILKKLYY